jgi:phytoene synthase
VVLALAASSLSPQALADLTQARFADLESEPYSDRAALIAYLDGTVGAVTRLAARRLDPGASSTINAARASGLADLWRLKRTSHRSRLPLEWTQDVVRREVATALMAARSESAALPMAAFPAIAPAALARSYVQGGEPGDLSRRLRLTWAVATGRLG